MEFAIGGVNINESVSDTLLATHPKVKIEILPYLGRVNNKGNIEVQYGVPIAMDVQMQVPSDQALQHVRRLNDNSVRRAFWISFPVYPMNRRLKTGSDRIRYDGKIYEITWIEDFSVTGWVQVIGEEQLNVD